MCCKTTSKGDRTDSEVSVRMHPWMPIAREKMIRVAADWVVTMITPIEKIQEMYEKQVLEDGKETDQTTDSDKQSKTSNTD